MARVHVEELCVSSEIATTVGSLGCLYGVSFPGCLWLVLSKCQLETGHSCPARGPVSCLASASWALGLRRTSQAASLVRLKTSQPSDHAARKLPTAALTVQLLTQKILWRTYCFWSPVYLFLEASSENFHYARNYVTCKTEGPIAIIIKIKSQICTSSP